MSNVSSQKTKAICVKLTPAQYKKLEQRAEQRGMPISAWMRSICLQAADRPVKDGYTRVREPNGAMI